MGNNYNNNNQDQPIDIKPIEKAFNEQFDRYFKSGSAKLIREGIALAKSNGAFVFSPSPVIDDMDTGLFFPTVNVVFLQEHEIYNAQGAYRINWTGLARMGFAADFKWSIEQTRRTDREINDDFVSYTAVGGVISSDGSISWHVGDKDIDLKITKKELQIQYKASWAKVKNIDDKAKTAWKKHGHKSETTFVRAMVKRDMLQKRKNRLTSAQSGAKARVLRPVLGIQGNYKNKHDVIGMPFLFVQYQVNHKRNDIKQAMVDYLPTSLAQLFGGRIPKQLPASHDDDSIDAEYQTVDEENQNTEPEHEPEHEPDNQQPNNLDNQTVDFENIDIADQIETMKAICNKINYSWEFYEEKWESKGGAAKVPQQWRTDLFIFLNNDPPKIEGKK